MACSCIEKFDELLRPRNTRLQTALVFGRGSENQVMLTLVPHIGTQQIEKGRGKGKAIGVSPTFCPFCGAAYDLPENPGTSEQEGSA